MNEENKVIILSLWNNVAESESKVIEDAKQSFPIISASALVYSSFRGPSLGSTPSTSIVVDPQIPEAQILTTWRSKNMKAIIETAAAKDYFVRDDSSTPISTAALSTIAGIAAEVKVSCGFSLFLKI
ncbi:hypothetical protein ACJIZ3_022997 [Penstemon smallii]|uniref:Uncharacterized protein n=1 Tax=Penstemon smallii TaxID=265156 RepID=A0ABD3TP44_9LAMI